MKNRETSLLLAILFLSVPFSSYAEILMPWKRTPLPIDLHVGQERIIFVDKNVQVGLPPSLDGKLRVQSMGGAVYLKPTETFDLNRIQLRDIESGQIILLDLKSRSLKGKLESVRIIIDETVENNTKSVSQTQVADPKATNNIESSLPAPAALIRYAAQSLYAPLRTVEPLPGVRRITTKLPKNIPHLMSNLSLKATLLDSWGLGRYVVTAIKLENLASYQVNLDPRNLQGYFYSAAFQHDWLGAKGSSEDTTVVYLVTEGSPNRAFILPHTIKTKTKSVRK
ncbi:TIGR03749 family integrating conjugative element protein [Pasteurella skyensis]|uniref:TIGR03749 family integrating conjugative element protein n=1 Tax=Phocoenobacter skyensis TaxID=97481 RepID=UPI002772D327|nr:TIGR03749 family integrating conjugative element protein [Pasteurella skyensis]MDP8189069.1 TIGR03749 family integrating conjugative element protein [Pasteurella skyensis]